MEQNRPGFYAVIPADVRYNEELTPNAKLFYAEITALAEKTGYCYADNDYFMEAYKFSERTVTRLITQLEACGYIIRQMIRDKEGKVSQRRLYLRESASCGLPPDKIGGDRQNCHPPTAKIGGYINTGNISKKENKKEKARPSPMDDTQLKDFWVDWITKAAGPDWTNRGKKDLYKSLIAFYEPRETKKQEPSRTAAACTRLGNLLVQYGGGSPTAMVAMLDRATVSGWKSVFPPNNGKQTPPEVSCGGGDYDEY